MGSARQAIALIDGNNFYAACEQALDPALMGRPVAVPGPIRSVSQKGWPAPFICVVLRGNRSSALGSQPTTPVTATDLISFLKALPDCRMRRGIRFPQVDAAGGDSRDPEQPGIASGD
ncbi:hypothetical protein [Synechococcus sp. CS-1328]|uniref:hypothetical protein n=1 Tax=Synechococcus sp. CS-1328 TaxID=2847976 RepID=UPI00223A71E5|nr:hypothetical protein [Synechococcus sp. CS-1328]MCT0224769.1 hypothetical protein [Synechococcus sp. CS-1328]